MSDQSSTAPAGNSSEKPQELTGRARSLANLRPWQKGQRGGPGRRKLPLSEALTKKIGRKRALQLAEAIIAKAETGDVPAWNTVADRVEGPVVQRVEMQVTGLAERIARYRARCIDIEATETSDEQQLQASSTDPPKR